MIGDPFPDSIQNTGKPYCFVPHLQAELLTSRPWILSGSSNRALLRIEIIAPFLTLLSPVASADFVEQSACGAESGLMKSNSLEAVNPFVQRVSNFLLSDVMYGIWAIT